jgi:hypothetical protein
MAAANHSSSKRPHWVTGGVALLVLAGCSSGGSMLGKDLRLFTFDDGGGIAEAAPVLKPTLDDTASVETGKVKIVPATDTAVRSHWCDYLREDAAAQTTIMRSPTLGASLKDDASASVSLGMSLSGLAKASLLEKAADVRCQKYLAENGLQKLVFVSPQGLTAAGHKSRVNFIDGQRKEIARLRRKAALALSAGSMDRERATNINVLADQILADAAASRSQADRRLDATLMLNGSAKAYGEALLAAEADLEDISNRMRTFDAFDVSASVGWGDDVNDNGFEATDQSFSGKVSFSMKLGAALPKRFEHEAAAKDAKLRAIKEEEGGALWQVSLLRRAHERAIEGLVLQKGRLADAILKAEDLARMLASVDNPEFEPPLIQAKLQLIKLRADQSAVAGSISEIRANMQRLKTG